LRRAFLGAALALSAALVWASFIPAAGHAFGGGWHWLAHFGAFLALALAWRGALPRAPAWGVALGVIAFGFAQEAIEVVGHAHGYELGDALVDALGAVVGIALARLVAGVGAR